MKKNIKIVIFDLDGTLVDAYSAVHQSMNFALRKMKLPTMDYETIKKRVGWGETVLVKSFVSEELVDKTLKIFRNHHKDALKKATKTLPGSRRLLKKLRKEGYKLAIATNRPSRFTYMILRELDIKKYFHCVVCADKVARPKPAPDMINTILDKFNFKPKEAVYIGDMTVDVITGIKACVKTVAVTTGSSSRRDMKTLGPYRIINDIFKVSDIVTRLN